MDKAEFARNMLTTDDEKRVVQHTAESDNAAQQYCSEQYFGDDIAILECTQELLSYKEKDTVVSPGDCMEYAVKMCEVVNRTDAACIEYYKDKCATSKGSLVSGAAASPSSANKKKKKKKKNKDEAKTKNNPPCKNATSDEAGGNQYVFNPFIYANHTQQGTAGVAKCAKLYTYPSIKSTEPIKATDYKGNPSGGGNKCNNPDTDMQKNKQKWVSAGWGPYCSHKQDAGLGDYLICSSKIKLYAKQMESKCTSEKAQFRVNNVVEEHETRYENFKHRGNSNRAPRGVAHSVPHKKELATTTDCASSQEIEDSFKNGSYQYTPVTYKKPVDEEKNNNPPSGGGNSPAENTNIEKYRDTCLQLKSAESETSDHVSTNANKKATIKPGKKPKPIHYGAENEFESLGIKPGAFVSCSCRKCLMTQDLTFTTYSDVLTWEEGAGADTPVVVPVEDIDDLASEEETETDEERSIPYAYGTNIIAGTVVALDDTTAKVCATSFDSFDATFKLTQNNQDEVLRILYKGTDISELVDWTAYTTNDGTFVDVKGVSKAWINISRGTIDIAFEITEGGTESGNVSVATAATTGPYTDAIYRPDLGTIYALDATRHVVELRYHDLTVDRVYDYTIPAGVKFSVSPVGDIVYISGGDVHVYNDDAKKEVVVAGAFPNGNDDIVFRTDDVWIDYRKITPFQHDTFRQHPVINMQTWLPHYRAQKLGSGYYILNRFHTSGAVVVPAHVADLDLARKQRLYTFQHDDGGTNYYHYSVALDTTADMIVTLYWEPDSFNCYARARPKTYKFSERNLHLEHSSVFDGDGEVGIVPDFRGEMRTTSRNTNHRIGVTCFKYSRILLYTDAWDVFDFSLGRLGAYNDNAYAWTDSTRSDLVKLHTVAAPAPLGDVDPLDIDGQYFFYIGEGNKLVKFDVINGKFDILATVGGVSDVRSQKMTSTHIVHFDDGGTLKYVDVYKSTLFNIAAAVRRLCTDFGVACVDEEPVYGYLQGFAIKSDDIKPTIKNLTATTTLRVHFHNGDHLVCTGSKPPIPVNTDYNYRDWETTKVPRFGEPDIELKFLAATSGVRGISYLKNSETSKFTLTTNISTADAVPLCKNAAIAKTERIKWTTATIDINAGLHSLYDTVEVDNGSFSVKFEHTHQVDNKLIPPLVTSYNYTGAVKWRNVRPVIVNNEYQFANIEDLSFGYKDGALITLYNVPVDVSNKVLFGARNAEYITFDDLELVSGDTYRITNMNRGAFNSGDASLYNGDGDSGLFILMTTPPYTYSYGNPPTSNVIQQKGREVVVPSQGLNERVTPSPVILRASYDKLRLDTRAGNLSTGKYLAIYYWGDNDSYDARLLYNTVSQLGAETAARLLDEQPAGRFIHITTGEAGDDLDVPSHKLIQYLDNENRAYVDIACEGETWTVTDAHFDKFHEYTGNWYPDWRQTPNILGPANQDVASEIHKDLFKRVAVSHKGNKWIGIMDTLDLIFKSGEIGILTNWADYYGDPAKNSITEPLLYHPAHNDLGPMFPTVGNGITPLRDMFIHLLYPDYNKWASYATLLDIDSPNYPGNYYTYWRDRGDALDTYNQEFLEGIEVVMTLLDNYYLGIPVPEWMFPYLEEYGWQPPYSLEVHDPNGEKITAFFEKLIEEKWPYRPATDKGRINVLVAEQQRDGIWGKFKIYEGIGVVDDIDVPCASNHVTKEAETLAANAATTYAVMEYNGVVMSQFSLSYMVAPYVPPTDYADLRNMKVYVAVNYNSFSFYNTATYTLLQQDTTRVQAFGTYLLL